MSGEDDKPGKGETRQVHIGWLVLFCLAVVLAYALLRGAFS
ncbi:hypothetical protein [Fundidesulfovibrio soli]|nr:hypothetical protein [Fundidesulfovibrio soli]